MASLFYPALNIHRRRYSKCLQNTEYIFLTKRHHKNSLHDHCRFSVAGGYFFCIHRLPEIKEEDVEDDGHGHKSFSPSVFRHRHVLWAVIAQFLRRCAGRCR
jgi:hypothetical protein